MRRALVGAMVGLAVAGAAAAQQAAEIREIVVTGEGRVDVAPDMAIVEGGVETEAATAEAALADNARAMAAIIAALTDAGLPREALQTSQLALFPVYPERTQGTWAPEVRGYRASNILRVEVRAIDQLGAVLDAMAAAGANRLGGIRFAIAEPRGHLDAARRAAVADARAKAELMAEAAGVRVGRVTGIRETQPFDRPFPVQARAEMAMDAAIAEGTLAVEAMVEIVYAIDDAADGENGAGD